MAVRLSISLPDELMRDADETSRELGLSRSALVTVALREFLGRRRQTRITEQLNKDYSRKLPAKDGQMVRKLRTKATLPDRW
jgi:predicted transcriptional regulator